MENDRRVEELLRHTRWIEALAQRLVRDPAAAEDLAQSAWVIALRAQDAPRTNLRGWLGTVLRNLARERQRREAARPAVEGTAARGEELPSAGELLARAEAERRLVEIVTQLDDPHRSILLLRYFEGLAPAEIARREGVELASVTHRITRAHSRLREKLRERDGGAGWLAALAPILRVPAPQGALPIWSLCMSAALKIALPLVLLAGAALLWSRSGSTPAIEPVHAPLAGAQTAVETESASTDTQRTPQVLQENAPYVSVPNAESAAPEVGRIRGRVYRPDGQLTSGRRVRLVDMAPVHAKGQGELWAVCNELGAFERSDLEPGVWSVSTWPDEAELKAAGIPFEGTLEGMSFLAERTLELAAGADIELELGAPPEHPIHVHGAVLADGKQRKPFAVQWLPAGEGIYDLKKNARVTPEGGYETTLEKPGTYYVTAILEDARPQWTVEIPQTSDLALDFAVEPFVLEGRVVQSGDLPVAHATVELSVRGGRRAPLILSSMGFNATTDEQGRFRFAGLPDAQYCVHAYGGELGAAASGVVRPTRAGERREVVIALEAGIRVPVSVHDAAGKEKFASVFVFDANGEALNPASGQTLGKAKEKTLIPLAPGRYSVVAAAGLLWSSPRFVEVRSGETPEPIDLQVEPAAALEIDATHVSGALLEVADEAGRNFGSLIDRARFNRAVERSFDEDRPLLRLPAGNYTILAQGLEGVLARAKVGLASGESRSLSLNP
ncbi:MAG: sigma-70 family RNA polymerase sigma factor [Planctomycetes bacterium]|nr:sigma-70 family RNA polymerase sigma factor [Planctomycetota bacterium]